MPRHTKKPSRAQQLTVQRKAKRQVKRRKTGEFRAKKKRVEVVSIVRSERGRTPLPLGGAGVKFFGRVGTVDPLSQVGLGQPTSKQDYFLLSRAIANWNWDPKTWILEVEFTSNHVYQFIGVNPNIWRKLQDAPSKGRAFHKYIYGHWTGKKGSKVYHPTYREVRIK